MTIDRELYIHPKQDEAYNKYKDGCAWGLQGTIESVYDEIDFRMRQPDLMGKTVRVTSKQFPKVYGMLENMCGRAGITIPAVYVYEDYYYGAESYGISNPWIEVSAKTIADFTDKELMFTLARELYKIEDKVTRLRTAMEEWFKILKSVPSIPGFDDVFEKTSRISFFHWYRLTNYTADNYGYIMCDDLKASVNAIIKMVLNSIELAEQVDIGEFIVQASNINENDDLISNYTKADESIPYAPHRIQNLLAYAVSDRHMSII
ncbi:MAG: M48 family metallopeptidase [Lachnospiraceae bacterium]|nr:M48 family metallopeptidase [Lachnospiraceae bacterium]